MHAPLTVTVKRFDPELPLPTRKTPGAAGFDLSCRLDTVVPPHGFALLPLNVAITVPPGYWVLLAPRSSTYRYNLLPANGIGIGDSDYCGNDDEYFFPVYNISDEPVTVTRGVRIAQLVILSQPPINLIEAEALPAPNRGGFGSTGTR